MKRGQKQTGFTIVELLIVIILIAILAAITVVAFNGIRQRAVNNAVVSDLRHDIVKLRNYIDINGKLPGTYQELVNGQFGGSATVEDSLIGTNRAYFRNVPNTNSNNGFKLCTYRPAGAPASENRMMLAAVSPTLSVFAASIDNLAVLDLTQKYNDYVTATGLMDPCDAVVTTYGATQTVVGAWYMQPYVRYPADCRCP